MSVKAKEIADRLKLSPSAVSLAMNGRPGVSEATRERVLAEAVRMGYTVRKRGGTRRNVRYVIFLDRGDAVKETSFYSVVLQGIEAKAKETGCNVLISYFYANGDWSEQVHDIRKGVAGILLLATEVSDEHIERARESGLLQSLRGVPIVLLDKVTNRADVDCVVADNLYGAYQAAAYLLEKGHPDVGYLRSKSRIDSFDEREEGLKRARKAHHIPDGVPLSTVDVGIGSEQAYYDMRTWLEGGGIPLSAYFADNDIIAAACIRALKTKGCRVPQDVSVVGFDDMPVCTMIDPALTTVRIMKEQMGMTAMGVLLHRIQQGVAESRGESEGVYHTAISTSLIERESVIPWRH